MALSAAVRQALFQSVRSLDDLRAAGKIVCAYSMRKLFGAYTGNCLQVSDVATGLTTTDIGFSGPWVDDATVQALGYAVNASIFYDQGTLVADTAQATNANRPTYVSAAQNGQPALDFDGSNDLLVSPTIIVPAGALAVFAVVRRDAGDGYSQIIDSGITTTAKFALYAGTGGTTQDWVNGDKMFVGNGYNAGQTPKVITTGSGSFTDDVWHQIDGQLSSNTADLTVDGILQGKRVSSPGLIPSVSATLSLGGATDKLDGRVAEVIVVTGDINTATRKAIRNGQRLAWGTP